MRAVIAIVALLAGTAHAEDARVVAARGAYDELDFQRVLTTLAPALADTLTEHDRAAALRLEGCAHMVLDERDKAIASFKASFQLEPDAALEPRLASSPDASSLFEIARGEWNAAVVAEIEALAAEIKKLQLHVRAPAEARGGQPIAIDLDFSDATRLVSRIDLSFRRRGQSAFTQITHKPSELHFEVPSDVTESRDPFVLEYRVTLRHQSGAPLERFGDPDHPHVIAVAAGHRPRWHELWWVRGAIALGVVGLGVGGYLTYRSIDVGTQNVVAK